MKYWILIGLLPLTLTLPAAALAQRIAKRPFKGANVILLNTDESAVYSLQLLATVCRKQGYTIDSLTQDILITTYRPEVAQQVDRQGSAPYRFTAVVAMKRGGATALILWATRQEQDTDGRLVERQIKWNKPSNNSPDTACFIRAQQLALAYPNGLVRYSKEKLKY